MRIDQRQLGFGDGFDYESGHAWVSVETSGQVIYLGLWPGGHPRVVDKRPECTDVRVGFEVGARALVSRYYHLSPSQVLRLNGFINRPDVWGYFNTCAAWATKVMREVVGTRISAVDYALFSTPRELGKELKFLEARFPTTRANPRHGEFQEPSFGSR